MNRIKDSENKGKNKEKLNKNIEEEEEFDLKEKSEINQKNKDDYIDLLDIPNENVIFGNELNNEEMGNFDNKTISAFEENQDFENKYQENSVNLSQKIKTRSKKDEENLEEEPNRQYEKRRKIMKKIQKEKKMNQKNKKMKLMKKTKMRKKMKKL